MKIALVIGNYNGLGGGAERWTDRHAQYLLGAGHDVHLVSRAFKNSPANAILHSVERSRGRLLFAASAESLLKRIGFDAVHDMGDGWHGDVFSPHHGTRAGGFLAGDLMSPPLWRPIRKLSRSWLPRYREFRALEERQFAAGSFGVVVALSHRVRADIVHHFGLDSRRIVVIYNGVDGDKFHPPNSADLLARRVQLRHSWGWSDRVIFLLVAHNFRLKGLDSLLRATARLRSGAKKIGLLVAGNDHSRRYRTLARRLGVGGDVRFLGDQSDAAPLFQAADVYVQPTFYDPCSLVVLEAMASGMPTITTKANGAGELLEHGRSGFILNDPHDDETLAQFMGAALDEPFRRSAGLAARDVAERNTMEMNSQRYLDLYESRSSNRRAA